MVAEGSRPSRHQNVRSSLGLLLSFNNSQEVVNSGTLNWLKPSLCQVLSVNFSRYSPTGIFPSMNRPAFHRVSASLLMRDLRKIFPPADESFLSMRMFKAFYATSYSIERISRPPSGIEGYHVLQPFLLENSINSVLSSYQPAAICNIDMANSSRHCDTCQDQFEVLTNL